MTVTLTGPAIGDEREEADKSVSVVLAIAEPEYKTEQTLPIFAARELHAKLGFDITICGPDPVFADRLAGFIEALEHADVLILSIRRRALHPDEMAAFKAYLAAGKPLLAIRTSNHAFFPRGEYPQGYATWEQFDGQVIGGSYHGHHGVGPKTTVTRVEGAGNHPILTGLKTPFPAHGSLYEVSPLKPAARPLLMGAIEGKPPEPVAWTHTYHESRVFYTSLGHADDFVEPQFVRLLRNAVLWALGRPTAENDQ